MVRQNDNWEEVESANFVKFEEVGQEVEGELIEKGKSEQYKFGMYTVMDEDGNQNRFHGSQQLDDLMLTVNVGDYIKVVFVDKEKMPKGEMKLFKVMRKN